MFRRKPDAAPRGGLAGLVARRTGLREADDAAPAPYRRVLVGADGTLSCEVAIAWAAWLAEGSPVVAVTVATETIPDAAATLSAALGRLHALGAAAEGRLLSGDPGRAIVAEAAARRADLVVLASHDQARTGFAGAVGVADAVAGQVGCDVLLARRPPPPASVAVAVDGSAASVRAASRALALAARVRAPLDLLHCAPDAGGLASASAPEQVAAVGVPLRWQKLAGSPGPAVVAATDQAHTGLLVVGHRGAAAAGGASWSLGRTSLHVARMARASVLVAKGP